jgi:hypothetical protein
MQVAGSLRARVSQIPTCGSLHLFRKRFPIDAPIQATGPLNGFRLLLLSMLLPALVQLLSDDRSVRALRMTIRPGAVPPRVPVMADRVEARDA